MRYFDKIQIAANGSLAQQCPGKVLTVKNCSLPSGVVAVIGANQYPIKSGTVVPESEFRCVNFVNQNAVAVTISFWIGDDAAKFTADDNSTANASTFALGNLGVAVGAVAANGLPACDGNGYLLITNAMALIVAGTYQGHRRQIITFSLSANSPAPLNLLDANGFAFMTIAAGQQIALVTDATFTLSGAGGTAWATVGQIFLNS
jgi:hypothetical protein